MAFLDQGVQPDGTALPALVGTGRCASRAQLTIRARPRLPIPAPAAGALPGTLTSLIGAGVPGATAAYFADLTGSGVLAGVGGALAFLLMAPWLGRGRGSQGRSRR